MQKVRVSVTSMPPLKKSYRNASKKNCENNFWKALLQCILAFTKKRYPFYFTLLGELYKSIDPPNEMRKCPLIMS
jgi:hypothetical protein